MKIKITCIYFKESGKYYSDGEEEFDKAEFYGCIYPRDYGVLLKKRFMLPGLESGTWDHPFIVNVDNGYFELVLP